MAKTSEPPAAKSVDEAKAELDERDDSSGDDLVGKYVTWVDSDLANNTATVQHGHIVQVYTDGVAEIPGSKIKMPASEDAPVVLIEGADDDSLYALRLASEVYPDDDNANAEEEPDDE